MKTINKLLLTITLVLFTASSLFATPQSTRTWKDTSGKFEVKAEFVRIDGDKVVIKKADGTMLNVPIDRLSPIDQGYVEGRRSASGGTEEANPFKTMTSPNSTSPNSPSPTTPSSPTTGSSASAADPAQPRNLSVNFTDCSETAIIKGEWNPSLGEQPSLPFSLKPIALKPKADFWEKYNRSTFNVVAKRAVITHHFGRPGKPATTRMEMIDLETGKNLGNASGDGKWVALAIHDDGERVVIQNMSDDKTTMGQLGTVKIRGKKLVPLDLWKPYEAMSEPPKEQIVRFAKFINNGRLLTLSQNGKVVIWDFESRKPVRRFSYHGACQPSLSHDRKHLAICGGDIFGIVNLEDDSEAPSVKDAPQMNYWLSSAFSPSCKRFAAATMQKLMVWDVASGDVLFEGKIPGLATNGNLHFPDEDFVMVNNDKLVEFASGIKVWRYQGAAYVNVNGESGFIHIGKNSRLFPLKLPHGDAKDMLSKAKSQSDLFILKKGSKVSIDLNDVPQQYRGDVEQSLKENLENKGFVYASSAPVSLKATITGPTQEAVSYHFAGSFVVRQFNSSLKIMYDGKSLWGASRNNIPGMVSGRDKAGIKKQLDEAGRGPNIKFFAGAQLPDFLQKPTGDGQTNRDPQMLGSSTVGANGIQ